MPAVSVVGPGQSSFVGVDPPHASPLALETHPVHFILPVVPLAGLLRTQD